MHRLSPLAFLVLAIGLLLVSAVAPPTEVFAQPAGGSNPRTITLPNPLGCNTFEECANKIIDALLIVAIPIVTIMVLYGGFQMMTAGGDPEKFTNGRKTVLYAAIGLVVVLCLLYTSPSPRD